jgi:DNA-binding transcriptional MocR family regulator
MLKEERFEAILQKLHKTQKVLSADLSHELRVSEDTIRRDLKELADAGLLTKVHGGALPKSTLPLSFREREQHRRTRKAGDCPQGGGPARRRAAHHPRRRHHHPPDCPAAAGNPAGHVFTNSPPIALQLADHRAWKWCWPAANCEKKPG